MNSAECIEAFLELGSPFIADGMQQLDLPPGVADPSIRPLLPDERVAGTAVTVRLGYYPSNPPVPVRAYDAAFNQAGQVPRPVLVAESRLGNRSPFGGGACRSFQHAGLTGVIIDGAIRDTADIKALGLQMFHRLICAESFIRDRMPEGFVGAEADLDVAIGGIRVGPGDLVIADEDGVVFCPVADAPAVIEAARAILAEEEEIFSRWDAGEGYLKGLGIDS